MAEVFIPARSEYIDQVEYDDETEALTVTFKDGAAFLYDGVPKSQFMAMQHAPSVGSFFRSYIRDAYPAEPIG